MTETIDITPTREGQVLMARTIAAQILKDVKRSRHADDVELMAGLLDLVFTAGYNAAVRPIRGDAQREAYIQEVLR